MPATRTQIYLTDEQRRRIDALVESEGVTLAEVIRRALDDFFERRTTDPANALETTFGADPDITAPSRDEWGCG